MESFLEAMAVDLVILALREIIAAKSINKTRAVCASSGCLVEHQVARDHTSLRVIIGWICLTTAADAVHKLRLDST